MPTVEDYYGASLYGSNDQPSSIDVNQDKLSNCYFMGDAISLADQQPDTLKSAIRFNAEDGSFDVRLYERNTAGGRGFAAVARIVHVTQEQINDNIKRGGGSSLDNADPGHEPGMWPAVLETAFAVSNDSNPSNGLEEGYQRISGNGGSARDAMFTLTGVEGKEFLLTNGAPVNGLSPEDLAFSALTGALRDKRPVVLSTATETFPAGPDGVTLELPHDGLMDRHTYGVASVFRENGVAMVDLINPLGHNRGNGIEAEPSEDNMITVPLSQLYATGQNSIILGPRASQVGGGVDVPLPVAALPRPIALTGAASPKPAESSFDYIERKASELLRNIFGPPSPPPLPTPPPKN
ncbi:MAG: hypothetical protein H7Y33_07655 [Cytophagales bacterium]|nr:hypothetical protein [Rhizobacter sp.]